MNRRERRMYDRRIKHYPKAKQCPACKQLTRFIPNSSGPETCMICERCGHVVAENVMADKPCVLKGAAL